ncbi:MAG TPA: VTT domain-containing protein [Myxococcota bacterium]|nr:VTT domain-containing protein [Myxococcota bacterium]
MASSNILTAGRNCWRTARASRLSVLVDADAYYRAFADAARQAQRQILILGWDIDSRLELTRPADPHDALPNRLGPFLDKLVRLTPDLNVYILAWDFSLIYALEREVLPRLSFGARTHRRVHFKLDAEHPVGASQHQKVVVIDDSVAFCGGLDFAESRWDTPEHSPKNPLRKTHEGKPYAPFHDVQVMVAGEAAEALGDLARERWRAATGKRLAPVTNREANVVDGSELPWPRDFGIELRNIDVGISRTFGARGKHAEVREVEHLYADSIAAAQTRIYIESQYLTSRSITKALTSSLTAPKGPEIVMVLPRIASGWLEQNTMSVLRGRLLELLAEADRHKRLRVLCPTMPGVQGGCINVHSKVMIVDDRLARIGSSNLSNRSMGLDSECDIAWEGTTFAAREHIDGLRHRLIAEHLGLTPDMYAQAEERLGMIGAVDSLRQSNARSLSPIGPPEPSMLKNDVLPNERLVDPESAIDVDKVLDTLLPEEQARSASGPLWRTIAIVVSMLLLAVAYRFTPLHEILDPKRLAALAAPLRNEPWMWGAAVIAFIGAGLLSFPLTLLVLQTGLVFGALRGIPIALTGALLSGTLTFGIGRLIGKDTIQRLGGRRMRYLVSRFKKSGVIAVVSIRLMPIAPFSIVNVIAGATGVRFSRFILGTAIGILPGIISVNVFGASVFEAIATRDPKGLVTAAAVGLALLGVGIWLRRRLGRTPKRDVYPERRGAAAVRA